MKTKFKELCLLMEGEIIKKDAFIDGNLFGDAILEEYGYFSLLEGSYEIASERILKKIKKIFDNILKKVSSRVRSFARSIMYFIISVFKYIIKLSEILGTSFILAFFARAIALSLTSTRNLGEFVDKMQSEHGGKYTKKASDIIKKILTSIENFVSFVVKSVNNLVKKNVVKKQKVEEYKEILKPYNEISVKNTLEKGKAEIKEKINNIRNKAKKVADDFVEYKAKRRTISMIERILNAIERRLDALETILDYTDEKIRQ